MNELARRPIGVFDSGVGGLSVLRALWSELPEEDFVYVADAGHAPYGEKDDLAVLMRAQALTHELRYRYGIKALVVACNTATAAAIAELRASHPDLPIVGIEPAVKPAMAQTRTGGVGVLATRGTLQSEKFRTLLQSLSATAAPKLQACDGLADAIERNDAMKIEALCTEYTRAIGPFGQNFGDCDTVVLGCTHYPFALDTLQRLCGPTVLFVEGGTPVAKRTAQVLATHCLRHPDTNRLGQTEFVTTGDKQALAAALQRWLGVLPDSANLAPNQAVGPMSSGAPAKQM
ncbi:glutamate racemase [Curvibacter sp. APW13]|uniref:glutamate racemase n=1 Tax=Curvibacter sp. APW13 TaxID=3077236 RepID=UPI0028DE377C|nr:glutamate racemase [Curvibacter sp. APW13]MDT8991236.1 glutamate racemase [Curvibacter sp. APW13]